VSPLFSSNNPRCTRLLELQQEINDIPQLDLALRRVIEAAMELTGSEAASLLLYEAESQSLRFAVTPEPHWSGLERVQVPLENSIAGMCFQRGETILLNKAGKEPRLLHQADLALGFKTHSLIAAPLNARGRTLGVLEVVNKRQGEYSASETALLEALAVQAALLLDASRLAEKVEQAQRAAAQLEKAKADFIAITSHDLRVPLGPILGHASILSEALADRPLLHSQADVIVENANRLRLLLETLVTTERTTSLKTKPLRPLVDISLLLDDLAQLFRPELERKRLTLMTSYTASGLLVRGDRETLAVALSSLLKNAIACNHEGGHVLLSAEKLPEHVKISVADDGIGLPPGSLEHIFEAFVPEEERLVPRRKALGLGLPAAKALIEQHNGQIWVESVEGRGSSFTILLPAGPSSSPRRLP
jgi:signal transduction histidine kinase